MTCRQVQVICLDRVSAVRSLINYSPIYSLKTIEIDYLYLSTSTCSRSHFNVDFEKYQKVSYSSKKSLVSWDDKLVCISSSALLGGSGPMWVLGIGCDCWEWDRLTHLLVLSFWFQPRPRPHLLERPLAPLLEASSGCRSDGCRVQVQIHQYRELPPWYIDLYQNIRNLVPFSSLTIYLTPLYDHLIDSIRG